MKKPVILLLVSALGAMTAVGARVVVNPYYDMSSSITFGITKVELTDTATRVSADIYGLPGNWVRAGENFTLTGAQTGRVYSMRSLEGMPVGENVYLTDSAYLSATFVFPPLAPADSVADFTEVLDDASSGWKVSGLRLGAQPEGTKTRITGSLEGRPEASWLVLMPACSDSRVNKSLIVPVREGRFDYTLTTDETQMYELAPGPDILRGAWMMYCFFSEGGDVRADISADGSVSPASAVSGGPLTVRYCSQMGRQHRHIAESGIEALGDSLNESRTMYTPDYYAVMDAFMSGGDMPQAQRDSLLNEEKRLREGGLMYSTEGKAYNELSARVYAETDSMADEFIRTDTTLVGLYLIYKKVKYSHPGADALLPVFASVYQHRFPNHSYTKTLSALIGAEAAEPGRMVPDFTAPDLDGREYHLTDLIGGRVALVDLWASWCGPCRRHSKAMIPVYEKWKDRGFTVVGVARENMSTDAMAKAIEQDGYPWLNLVELNDRGRIWERYGAGNSGGLQVLVDSDGTVVALNPTPEEVEAYLESQRR